MLHLFLQFIIYYKSIYFFLLLYILKCNILSLNHLKKVKFSSKMKLITELGEKYCLQYRMSHYDLVIENYLMM